MIKFSFSDSILEQMTCKREQILLEFLDWREERWIITFNDVLGFKSVGAVGSEVSELFVRDETSLSRELALIDPSVTGFSYCITCARESNVVLIIVASGYTAEKCL